MELLSHHIEQILSCQRFLSLREICLLSHGTEEKCQKILNELEMNEYIQRRWHQGKYLYVWISPHKAIMSKAGRAACDFLERRGNFYGRNKANITFHLLGGEAGIAILKQLIQEQFIVEISPLRYRWSNKGKERVLFFLKCGHKCKNREVSTVVDPAMRQLCLSGVVGRELVGVLAYLEVIYIKDPSTIQVYKTLWNGKWIERLSAYAERPF